MNDSTPPQTPTPKPTTRRSSKKRWVVIFVTVLIIVLSAGAAWYVTSHKPRQNSTDVAPISERSKQINATIGDAQQLADNGKFTDAQKAYDQAVSASDDPYQKSILLMSKATLFFNDGKLDEALTIAKQALAANENSAVTSFIAQVYEAKNNPKQAIEYYKKTIPLVDKKDPLADEDIQYYQARIDELQGGAN